MKLLMTEVPEDETLEGMAYVSDSLVHVSEVIEHLFESENDEDKRVKLEMLTELLAMIAMIEVAKSSKEVSVIH